MNGIFIIRKDARPNEWGEMPVYIQYSIGKVAVKTSTGVRVKPEDWDGNGYKNSKWVRGTNSKAIDLNARLVKIKKHYDSIIDSFPSDRAITVPILRSILNGSYEQEVEMGKGLVSFVDHCFQYNESLYKMEKFSYSVWVNVQCNMKNFGKFLREKGYENRHKILMCRNMSETIISEYIDWRRARGNSNDTINKALTPIFKTLQDCARKGWLDRENAERMCMMYLPKASNLAADIAESVQYLTKAQVRQLIDTAHKSKYNRTKEFMDMFLFSLHTCGLRFSDVATLKWDNVDLENRTLRKILVKGHTRRNTMLAIPLSDESLRILRKWQGKYPTYVFGMLPDDFDLNDAAALKKTLNSKNRSINTSLGCLGDKIGLPFTLHFHIARHTWATLSLNEGVDVKIISSMMGHASVLVTEKVYSKFLPETLMATMDERLNFVI